MILGAFVFLCYIMIFIPLPSFTALVFIGQGLVSTTRAMGKYRRLLSRLTVKEHVVVKHGETKENENGLDIVITKGENILRLLNAMESSFGGLIFDEIVASLFLCVMGIYWSASCAFMIVRAINGFLVFLLTANTVMVAISFYRLIFTVLNGQNIEDAVEDVVDEVRDKLVAFYNDLTEVQRYR